MATRKAWRKDRITANVDEETGLRQVTLPTVKGMTKAQVQAVFDFERPILGTVRAVIRIQKREQGQDVPVPAKLVAAGIPTDLAPFYSA